MQRFQIISTPKVPPPKLEVKQDEPPADLEAVPLQRQVAFVKSGALGGASMTKKKAARPLSLPPNLQTTASVRHTYRFESSSAITSAFGITGQMLCGALGGVVTIANTQLTCWVSTAKIHEVVIWPGLASTSSVPGVLWSGVVGAVSKDSSIVSSLPGGVTIEGALVSRPPKDTLCDAWVNLPTLGSGALFSLENIPAQSIIDIKVTFQLRNNLGGFNLGLTGTVSLGSVVYTALDGPAVHKLIPVGLPTSN